MRLLDRILRSESRRKVVYKMFMNKLVKVFFQLNWTGQKPLIEFIPWLRFRAWFYTHIKKQPMGWSRIEIVDKF